MKDVRYKVDPESLKVAGPVRFSRYEFDTGHRTPQVVYDPEVIRKIPKTLVRKIERFAKELADFAWGINDGSTMISDPYENFPIYVGEPMGEHDVVTIRTETSIYAEGIENSVTMQALLDEILRKSYHSELYGQGVFMVFKGEI